MKPVTGEQLLHRWHALRAREGGQPANRALYACLREAILEGSLVPNERLPATRELALSLGISRNTVTHAYDQLLAEGYLRALTGSGTYVANVLPEQMLRTRRMGNAPPDGVKPAQRAPGLARRGAALVDRALASPMQWGAFMPGVPDVRLVPHRKLDQILARARRKAPPEWLSYASQGGHPELRAALCDHLRQARAIRCEPDQILLTEGVHQAVDLVSRLLADAGEQAWMEEPGYWGIRNVLAMNGLRVRGIRVDEEGLLLPRSSGRPPRLIFVTPSHQYPLGSVMSLSRRLALIGYARANGCWIIEDDYDSEFRFAGHPIPALQGLDPQAPVIYVGTFSKTLYPGLRIAYLVLPRPLAEAFRKAHSELYREGHLVTQAALATFIDEGHYAAHIRRMRLAYASRRAALQSLVRTRLGEDWFHPYDSNAGLHLVLKLPAGIGDVAVASEALERGVLVRPLSRYFAGAQPAQGLLLGFACVAEDQMLQPFERLLSCLERQATARRAK